MNSITCQKVHPGEIEWWKKSWFEPIYEILQKFKHPLRRLSDVVNVFLWDIKQGVDKYLIIDDV